MDKKLLLLVALLTGCSSAEPWPYTRPLDRVAALAYPATRVGFGARAGEEVPGWVIAPFEQASPERLVIDSLARRDPDEAFNLAKRALDARPEGFWARYAVARAFFAMGIYHRAEQAATRAVEVRDTMPEAWALLGDIRLARGHKQDAMDAYGRALDLDLQCFRARWGLARIYLEASNRERALEQLAFAAPLAPGLFEVHLAYAKLLEGAGERAAAHREYETATGLNGNSAPAWLGRARTALETGQEEDALVALRRFRKLDTTSQEGRLLLAELYERRKEWARADALYREALAAEPGSLTAALGLVRVREGAGDLVGAMEVLARLRGSGEPTPEAAGLSKRLLARTKAPTEPVTGDRDLQQVFDRILVRIHRCREELAPASKGELSARVHIGERGLVTQVELSTAAASSPELLGCVYWTIRTAKFPAKPRSGPAPPVTIDFPVRFP